MKQTISKKHYFLLIPLITTLMACTKINYVGSYTKDLGSNYYGYFSLRQDSTFEYRSNEYSNTTKPYMPIVTGPLDSVGVGRYEIRKNQVFLDYGNDTRPNVLVDRLDENMETSEFNLEFHMMANIDSTGLPFVAISYFKSIEGYLDGVVADVDGKAHLKIAPSDFPLELDFKFLGYAPEKVYLEEVGFYKISIYFHEAPKQLQGKRVYPITRIKDTLDINGHRKIIYPKVKTKK